MHIEKWNHWLAAIILLVGLALGHGTSAAAELPAYFKAKTTVNVRTEPNTSSSKVVTLKKGNSVLVESVQFSPGKPDWGRCTVEWLDEEGWVCMDYMEFDRPAPLRSNEREMSQWKKVLLHTAHFFGYKQENVWWFYGCFLVVAIAIFIASCLGPEFPFLTLLFHAIAIATTLWYCAGLQGELLWHANWESVRWWSIVGVGMYVLFMHVFKDLCKSAGRESKEDFREYPLFSIVCLVCCLGWGYVLFRFAAAFFMEHSFWVLLLLLGAIGSGSSTSTIYVEGEGYITGHGYDGGSKFHGNNGYDYYYDGSHWYRM